ncbi:MAG TPA: ribonuclease HII, partial [Chromatiaceae bacterium]|nr:ribonuclease HII [Chromatiaceae bacterium]
MSEVWVAGVDEAGRGPLAGPVAASAVILHPGRPILGLDDSKRLTQARRAALETEIRAKA